MASVLCSQLVWKVKRQNRPVAKEQFRVPCNKHKAEQVKKHGRKRKARRGAALVRDVDDED
jgi:hypothetical protein